MKDKRVILVDTGSESNHLMLSDIGRMKNAVQISNLYNLKGKIWDILFKIHFGFRLNKYIDIPFKEIWDKYCVLERMTDDNNYVYYIVLVNDVIRKISKRYLEELSKQENVRVITLLLDSFDSMQPYFKRCVKRFPGHKIYSFQKSDCDRFGFHYTTCLYSRLPMDVKVKDDLEYDVYYIGADKGRLDELYKIYKKLYHEGVICRFTVVVEKKKFLSYKKKYVGLDIVKNRIPYSTILHEISKTKGILEICQKGQDGLTMRFYEALFYNKLLITNNAKIMTHPYFDDCFMQYYKNVDDISAELLLSSERPNYHYDGRYSPRHFIENLLSEEL